MTSMCQGRLLGHNLVVREETGCWNPQAISCTRDQTLKLHFECVPDAIDFGLLKAKTSSDKFETREGSCFIFGMRQPSSGATVTLSRWDLLPHHLPTLAPA
jgi:hypothetical protein